MPAGPRVSATRQGASVKNPATRGPEVGVGVGVGVTVGVGVGVGVNVGVDTDVTVGVGVGPAFVVAFARFELPESPAPL